MDPNTVLYIEPIQDYLKEVVKRIREKTDNDLKLIFVSILILKYTFFYIIKNLNFKPSLFY